MPNIAYPSRISTIFYLGLEGLGGVDLITDEDENVRAVNLPQLPCSRLPGN